MNIWLELQDNERKIRIRWEFNTGTASIFSRDYTKLITTVPVLLPPNCTPVDFQNYIESRIDAIIEASGYKEEYSVKV